VHCWTGPKWRTLRPSPAWPAFPSSSRRSLAYACARAGSPSIPHPLATRAATGALGGDKIDAVALEDEAKTFSPSPARFLPHHGRRGRRRCEPPRVATFAASPRLRVSSLRLRPLLHLRQRTRVGKRHSAVHDSVFFLSPAHSGDDSGRLEPSPSPLSLPTGPL
jgi:hypothetical protein